MRIVGLDDDVYAYLVSHTRELGETPSQILRRLLAIGVEGPRHAREKRIAAALHPSRPHELTRCIKRAAWLAFDVERYLYLLRCLHDQKGFDFMVQALQIRGRTRRYFGRSAGDIERSGVATQPRPIAGSDCWALTNISTRDKERILRYVMTALGYSEPAMLAARDYLMRGKPSATL